MLPQIITWVASVADFSATKLGLIGQAQSSELGNCPETWSIMNALLVFQGSYSQTGPNNLMLTALIVSLPSVVLFFLLCRHLMEGLRMS